MELILLIIIVVAVAVILVETTAIWRRDTQKPRGRSTRKLYVDTSALMDGRILTIAKTGFLGGELIIPRSVIREMQLLADGKDSEKRSRARFGMDIASELTRADFITATILQDELDRTPVDERLLQLARNNGGEIITNDYNLEKVAATENIGVLNVNELALVLRAEFLPGETFTLKIVAAGSNPKQGTGYLPDGTMVVVDNAAKHIDQEIKVEFVRFIQTAAGRMMFAKPATTTERRTGGRKTTQKKARTGHKHTVRTAEDALFETIERTQES